MNIFEFVPLMKSLNSTVATIGIVAIAVFLVFIILKLLSGMAKGVYRQLVHFAFTIGSVVIAFVVTTALSDNITSLLSKNNIAALIPGLNSSGEGGATSVSSVLADMPTDALEQILLLPATIIAIPLAFLLIYMFLQFIFGIVSAIVCNVVKIKRAKNNSHRLGGALVAGVEGIIFFIIFLLPFMGVLNILDKTYEDAINDESTSISTKVETEYTENIVPLTQNPLVSFVGDLGGDALASHFATVEINGTESHLDEEIVPVLQFILIDCKADGKVEWNKLSEENKEDITKLLDSVSESKYLSGICVGFIQSGSGILLDGIASGEGQDDGSEKLLNSLTAFLEGFNEENFDEDIKTLRDLYFVLSDNGVLLVLKANGGDLMDVLVNETGDDSTVVTDIKNILQSNPRTSPIVKTITEMMLASLVNTESDVEVSYDELKNDMSNVLAVEKEHYETEEEYKDALSTTLDETLRDYGIELEEEIVDGIADYVDENYSDISELTDEEFNDILLQYYDVYLEYINSQK